MSFKEFLNEKSYKVYLNDEDYNVIRKASMRGKFNADFSRDDKGDVTFKTKNPMQLVKELDKLIDAGATSWFDILNITP